MKPFSHTTLSLAVAAALAFGPVTATADEHGGDNGMSFDEVRSELSEAMQALGDYTAQERDEALAAAREALDRADAEIERQEQALRENWAEMSEAAREDAAARLEDLREARNQLGERFGALRAGADSAWDDLTQGFSNAWDSFSDAWSDTAEDAMDATGNDADSGEESGN